MTSMKVCGICYKAVNHSDCEIVNDTITELLKVIFTSGELKELKNITDAALCKNCFGKIHETFNFKSMCVQVEDMLTPYFVNSVSNLNLKEIGQKENMFTEKNLHDIDEICRLCLVPIEIGKVKLESALIENGLQQIFDGNLPEVNLVAVRDSYICNSCLLCLQKYLELKTMCSESKLNIEELKETMDDNSLLVTKQELIGQNNGNKHSDNIERKPRRSAGTYILNDNEIPEEEIYKCDQCTFISIYLRSLQHHQKTIHLNPEFETCPQCSKKMKKAGLKKHIATVHNQTVKKHYCNQCNYSTPYKGSLNSHMLIHNDNCIQYQCEKCSYKSKHKEKLTRHLLLHVKEPPKHKCEICDYRTNYKENLKKHIRKHDNNAEVFSCDQCSYKTKHKGYLKLHKNIHAEPDKVVKYKCSICSYETIHRGNLIKQHMKTHKIGEQKTYECDQCNFKTLYVYHFKNHAKTHKSFDEVESFQCNICPFITKHKVSHTRHMKNHQNNDK